MRNVLSVTLLTLGMAGAAQADNQTAAAAAATVSVKAVQSNVQAGGKIVVEAYVSGAVNVSAYQVQLGASGGTKGTLTLESMTVDKQRSDFAFHQAGAELIDVQDKGAEWVGLVRTAGGSDIVKLSYVATFTFRASPDAQGVFKVNVRTDSTETFLLDQAGLLIPHKLGATAEVAVGTPAPVRKDGRKG